MAYGYCSICMKQQCSHRFSDRHASPNHNCAFAFNRNPIMLKQLHDAQWRAWHKSRRSTEQQPSIMGMKPIHIFCWLNSFEYMFNIDLFWQRQLNQNAMNSAVSV